MKDKPRIVCLHLSVRVCVCVCVCVALSTKSQTLKLIKMALSHADDLQRLQFKEERGGCEIKSGGNTRDGSPSILRSHLQSAFSLLPSFQKHLDVQASSGGIQGWIFEG